MQQPPRPNPALVRAQAERLIKRSDAFVRECNAFLAMGGFTPAERNVVMLARKITRLASSQRDEVTELGLRYFKPQARLQRHAAVAAALLEADRALDEAIEQIGGNTP